MNERIGELLVKESLLTTEQLRKAREEAKTKGGRLGAQITKLGFLEETELSDFVAKQYGVPSIDLAEFEIDDAIVSLVPEEVAIKHTVIPVNRAGSTLVIASADPSNILAIDDIKFLTGYDVEVVVASEESIKTAIDKCYDQATSVADIMSDFDDSDIDIIQESDELDAAELQKESEDAPVVKLVNLILTDAVKKSASDIHIEPYETEYRVRYRIDGILYEMMRPPLKLKEAITSRVKIMAKLDIAEKRLPQDGRIKIKTKLGGQIKDLDFRVSVLPSIFGEKIVLRLLDKDNLMLDMTKLGFEEESLRRFEQAIFRPYGMVLVTGPTGSGKTNTLYSALQRVNTPEVNIMTAEDPVEFNLTGINQVQMKEQIGLNFAATLRSFLRQDPNIVLVGEVRDFETAEVAIKAAMTGHLVLSTLHTNDAPSSINRLMNMGIEPFLVASSVHLVAAQRLVRRICAACKEPYEVPSQALGNIGFDSAEIKSLQLFRGRGCDVCSGTGYKGRIGLYEVMEVDEEVRELILSGASAYELRQKAIENGMISLRESGLQKIRDGVTSIDEVLRETVQ